MKTYTGRNRAGQSCKVRARSNAGALRAVASVFGGGEIRVFQGGFGFDSGWQTWLDKYAVVARGK